MNNELDSNFNKFVFQFIIRRSALKKVQFIEQNAFRRSDEQADEQFYTFPRLVTHIDDAAIAAVTEIYRELLPPDGAILDLMSSWVSHLPDEIDFKSVVGLGMNAEELNANPRLDQRIVQNLNQNQVLPFGDGEFDAATICVSVQYLTKPDRVFAEIRRVLKPAAPLIVTFSNRCFPTKAVYVWQMLDDNGHIALVSEYLRIGGFTAIETRKHEPRFGDPLFAVIGHARK